MVLPNPEPTNDPNPPTGWLNGVRFNPDGIEDLVSAIGDVDQLPTKPIAPQASQRGRPRKDWWEDLWVAMVIKFALTNFEPRRVGDVENAMLEWLDVNGHDYGGRTTVSSAARKLFLAVRDFDKNSSD